MAVSLPRVLAGVVLALALTVVSSPARAGHAESSGPVLEEPAEELAASLECAGQATGDDPDATSTEPVLLVHGTFANAEENWGWNYRRALSERGWDVCTVTMPGRSLGDIQTTAEYVVHAVRAVHERTGEQVDVLGHSQGALQPRWALRWWPDVRAAVDDLVMIGGPNHGTDVALVAPGSCFPSCWQMMPGSNFLAALNRDDETPGDVSYTSVYSATDELVQPVFPEATAALDGAANVLIQELCPGRPVEHAMLAADHAVHAVVLDALVHPGPADTSRLDPVEACAGSVFDGVDPVSEGPDMLARSFEDGFPDRESTDEEPPLRCYATLDGCGTSGADTSDGGDGDGPGAVDRDGDARSGGGSDAVPGAQVRGAAAGDALPATGAGGPNGAVAALLALGAAGLARIGAQHMERDFPRPARGDDRGCRHW